MTEHCRECGSRKCNHGNCPECYPCRHCYGGDREDKFFGYDEEPSAEELYRTFDGDDY